MYAPTIYTKDFISSLTKIKNIDFEKSVGEAITKSMFLLERKVKENLSGKNVNVKTGRLRRSFNTKLKNDAGISTWELGSNVSYAGVVEAGFSGLQQIKAHSRSTKFGAFKIRSHSRNVNRKGKYYFKNALVNFKEDVNKRVQENIRKAFKDL